MRFSRFLLFVSVLLLWFPVKGQQSQPTPTLPPATKDPQAVTLATQVLAAAGGVTAVTAITDYTATGNITYHWGDDVQGTVTVRGEGFGPLRIDAYLPSGVRSESILNGLTTTKAEDGGTLQRHTQSPINPSRLVLPYILLRPALTSPGYNLLYKSAVQVGIQSLQDIQLQRVLPVSNQTSSLAAYFTVDYFIDPSTFQVVMMQDQVVPNHTIRQIHYANYTKASGVLVPFSISVQHSGQSTWAIQLSNISFNTGLQDTDFQL